MNTLPSSRADMPALLQGRLQPAHRRSAPHRPLWRRAALAAILLLAGGALPAARGEVSRADADSAFQKAQQLNGQNSADSKQAAAQSFETAAQDYHQLNLPGQEAIARYDQGLIEYQLGASFHVAGALDKAIASYQQALALFQQSANSSGQATVLSQLGVVYAVRNDLPKAIDSYTQALPLVRQTGDKSKLARLLWNRGAAYESKGGPQLALADFKEASDLFQALGDQKSQAQVLVETGTIHANLGSPQQAEQELQQALPILEQQGDMQGQAAADSALGAVYANTGQIQKALESLNKALAIQRQSGDPRQQALTLIRLGEVYRLSSQPASALQAYNQAMALEAGGGDPGEQINIWIGIGCVQESTGKPDAAIQSFNKALILARATQNIEAEANAESDLGLAYADKGDPQTAVSNYQFALDHEARVKDQRAQATTLAAIGDVYWRVSDIKTALDYYQQALPLEQQAQDLQGEANTLNLIGLYYQQRGETDKAAQYFNQSLHLVQSTQAPDEQASALNSLGYSYAAKQDWTDALSSYNKALPLWQAASDPRGEATTLANIGIADDGMHQPDQALTYLNKALAEQRHVEDLQQECITLAESAHVLHELGQDDGPDGARARYDQSIKMADNLISNITADDLKRSASNSYQVVYASYIDYLLGRGLDDDNWSALEVSELARSRALRDLLAGNNSQLPGISANQQDSASGTPPSPSSPAAPLASQSVFDDDTSAPAAPSTPAAPAPGSNALGQARTTIVSETDRAASALSKVAEDLPPLASGEDTMPFQRSEAVKAAAAGPVISYHILSSDLAIFVIEPDGSLHVVRVSITPADLNRVIAQTRLDVISNDDPSERRVRLQALYQILMGPVSKWIAPPNSAQPTPVLTIVPYGPLFKVPFAALTDPDGRYLIQQYAIRIAPSLTVLRYTRAVSASLKGLPQRTLLFGDPTMPAGVISLPGTLKEVQAINSTLLSAGQHPQVFTNEAATEQAFRQDAPAATDIHLATHGYVVDSQPRLSGVILGPSAGPQPTYQRDGYLMVAEVFQLKLHASLVTLSACDTGLGATSSDGVFGLQTAFLKAGCASLLSSLWKVNDNATGLLMSRFYQELVKDPQHDRARALRDAQLSLVESSSYTDPFYWAAFTLTGEAE